MTGGRAWHPREPDCLACEAIGTRGETQLLGLLAGLRLGADPELIVRSFCFKHRRDVDIAAERMKARLDAEEG